MFTFLLARICTLGPPTALKTARTTPGAHYAYEDFVFLRSIAKDVSQAVEQISRNPHRRVIRRIESMDSWLATEITPAELASIATDPRSIARVSEIEQRRLVSPGARRAFTRSERLFGPVRLPGGRREVDYDTYENRFVRFVVTNFRQRALSIADAARRAGRPSLARDADDIAVRFASLLRLTPFAEVGDLTTFSSTSQVLLRQDAYNRLLRLYREFVLTAIRRPSRQPQPQILTVPVIACLSLCDNQIGRFEPPMGTGQFRSVPGHWR